MPTFCRHNRLLQNCTICAREQHFEARPVVSSARPKETQARDRTRSDTRARPERERPPRSRKTGSSREASVGVRVRRLARGLEDGYRSALVPGLKSSEDASRLAGEIAFSAARIDLMQHLASGVAADAAPASWLEIATDGDVETRTLTALGHVLGGERGLAADHPLDDALRSFQSWAARQGSVRAAFEGEPSWTAERRFERLFERLGGLRGFGRDVRFELLTLLGRLGVYELRAGRLFLGGENEVTWAAKRAFGIGDQLLLERRSSELAAACRTPVDALDLALHSWGAGSRPGEDLPEVLAGETEIRERVADALGL